MPAAPVHAFDRRPGHPAVTVTRLPADAPGNGGLPGGGPHAHDFLVLFYARRADGTLRIDGRTWTVRDGDAFVLAPGQVISSPARTTGSPRTPGRWRSPPT